MHIDFETRSEADIKVVGAWMYSRHPSTEILCMVYDDKIYIPDCFKDIPNDLNFEVLISDLTEDKMFAFNAMFERCIWHNICHKRWGWPDIPFDKWRCTAAKAAAHALPRSLEECSNVLKLSTVKDKEGHRVMLQLSQPRNPSKNNPAKWWERKTVPEKFEQLYSYCKTDVKVESLIDKEVRDFTPSELAIWQLDQKINLRGVKFDRKAILSAIQIMEDYSKNLEYELRDITKGYITSVGQSARLIEWLGENGCTTANVQAETIRELLTRKDLPDLTKRVLEIRRDLSKTSTAKYYPMLQSMDTDDRIRNVLVYHGASTGRWAGTRVQLHNLPRGNIKNMEACVKAIKKGDYAVLELLYGNVMDTLSSAIRGMIVGDSLYVADYNAIEARIVMWLAGEDKALHAFATGQDLYKEMAGLIYGVPTSQVTEDQRQLGKQAILGCGFGMGITKFIATCLKYNIQVTEELGGKAVGLYRRMYSGVPKLWYKVEECVRYALCSNQLITFRNLAFQVQGKFLYIKLPSGRLLSYPYPKLIDEKITFEGIDTYTHKWQRLTTYGGKLVENIVQGIARDIMAEGMLAQEASGYEVRLSVHDETINEHPNGSLEEYLKLTVPKLEWMGELPIVAKGWTGKRYMKK